MRIIQTDTYQAMSRKAAAVIAAQVIAKPDSTLGLATGDSPLGVYQCLIDWHKSGDIDFSQVKTVNLDEYRGLSPDDEQSYRFFMYKNLFSGINVPAENRHIPDGLAGDPAAECARYDDVIARCGGIDLQLLGIGNNGHIGFNEPADAFTKGTHCVGLTDSTIDANSRFFAKREDVPVRAYTMGVRTILSARKIVLIATGERKAQIIKQAFFGDITPLVPASALQLHGDVTLVGDKAALSLI